MKSAGRVALYDRQLHRGAHRSETAFTDSTTPTASPAAKTATRPGRMCAAFFQVSVINASVPALATGDDAGEEPKKELLKVTIHLQIGKAGYMAKGPSMFAASKLIEETADEYRRSVARPR